MIFSIASVDKNMGIGKDGKLLCRLRADMAFFREKTLGKTVVMGRKTQESLPKGAPLPDRRNIVMTGDRTYRTAGFTVVHSMGEAMEAAGQEDVAVIGGETVYRAFLPVVDCIYLTQFDRSFDADTFFPKLDEKEWTSEKLGGGEENGVKYGFFLWKKR